MAKRKKAVEKALEKAVEPTKGDARRLEILGAARRCLVEDGYDRFVLREIAQHVGVTVGNLQYYFSTRDDLLEAVIRAEFQSNQADMERLSALAGPARDRLSAIARHLLKVWAHEGGRVYVVMSLLALHQERFRRLHVEIYEDFYAGLLPVLKEIHPAATKAQLLATAKLLTTLIDGALVQVPGKSFVDEAIELVLEMAQKRAAGKRLAASATRTTRGNR